MNSLPFLLIVGFVGALLFTLLKLPGGAMTGSMLSVLLYTSITELPPPQTPSWMSFAIYTCVGVLIGSMYKPGMFHAIGSAWPVLLLSTGLILLAGCACAWIVARSGALSINSAYLATSPGGFNAIMGFSLTNEEAPIIMVYHLVRIYMVILLAPYLGQLIKFFLK